MEDKIKLFLQYMNKEKELVREWDREDGIDVDSPNYKQTLLSVDRVRAFISYRNIRIEEAWYTKLNRGNNDREIREKLYEYDAERSRRHSLALNSMIGLNDFGEMYGLPKFYDGELVRGQDIENYKNIDVRKEETKFFLGFVDQLCRTPGIVIEKYLAELGIDGEAKEEASFIRELQSNVDTIDRKYNVDKPLLEDDDTITFKDQEDLNRF